MELRRADTGQMLEILCTPSFMELTPGSRIHISIDAYKFYAEENEDRMVEVKPRHRGIGSGVLRLGNADLRAFCEITEQFDARQLRKRLQPQQLPHAPRAAPEEAPKQQSASPAPAANAANPEEHPPMAAAALASTRVPGTPIGGERADPAVEATAPTPTAGSEIEIQDAEYGELLSFIYHGGHGGGERIVELRERFAAGDVIGLTRFREAGFRGVQDGVTKNFLISKVQQLRRVPTASAEQPMEDAATQEAAAPMADAAAREAVAPMENVAAQEAAAPPSAPSAPADPGAAFSSQQFEDDLASHLERMPPTVAKAAPAAETSPAGDLIMPAVETSSEAAQPVPAAETSPEADQPMPAAETSPAADQPMPATPAAETLRTAASVNHTVCAFRGKRGGQCRTWAIADSNYCRRHAAMQSQVASGAGAGDQAPPVPLVPASQGQQPAPVQSSDDKGTSKGKFKGKSADANWATYDLEHVREPLGDICDLEVVWEHCDMDSILKFLSLTAARRCRTKVGTLIAEAFDTVLRVQKGGKYPVVRYRTEQHGFIRRSQSGVAGLGADLPQEVKDAFEYQIALRIPRSQMGKSCFAFGRLYRYVLGGRMGMAEIDMCLAFIQLRLRDCAGELTMPACSKLVACENPNEELERMSGGRLQQVKTVLKRFVNVASDDSVARDGINLNELPSRCLEFLRAVRDENREYLKWSAAKRPQLADVFTERPHPVLSRQALVDEDAESKVMAPLLRDFTAAGTSDTFFVVMAHDGVDLPVGADAKTWVARAEAVTGYRFSAKVYPHWLDFARLKFPEEDWSATSAIPAPLYLESHQRALQIGGGDYRKHSLIYRNIIEGRIQSRIVLVDGEAEFFDGLMWRRVSGMHHLVKTELEQALGRARPQTRYEGESGKTKFSLDLLRPPMSDGEFLGRLQGELQKFAQPAAFSQLDANNELLLLGNNGVVLNFATGECMHNEADLRLFRHCAVPLPKNLREAVNNDNLWHDGEKLIDLLKQFYLAGGVDVLEAVTTLAEDDEDEQDGSSAAARSADDEARRDIAAMAVEIQSLFMSLVERSEVLKQTFTTLNNLDTAIYWQRAESRAFSGRLGWAQAYVLSGPKGCGKSKLLVRIQAVLGTDFNQLGATLPQTYFTKEESRSGNDSLPALAKLRGKRWVSCKELRSSDGVKSHALKNILDQTDIDVDARCNNSHASANTTFPVSWVIMWAQNGDVKYSEADGSESDQLVDKLVEFRPGNVFGEGVAADPNMKNLKHFARPTWVAELLMWAVFFDRLNGTDINSDRTLHPMPALQRTYQEAHAESVQQIKLKTRLSEWLEYCSRKEATDADKIEKKLKESFNVGGTALTACGLGSAQKSLRRTGGRQGGYGTQREHIFVAALRDGDDPAPIRLKAV